MYLTDARTRTRGATSVGAAFVTLAFSAVLLSSFAPSPARAYPLVHLRGPDLRDVVCANTREMWVVAVLAPPSRCGEACEKAKETFQMVAERSGIFRFGWMDAFDAVLDDNGEEMDVRRLFNFSAVPAMVLFPMGPKRIDKAMKLDPQFSGHLMSSPKVLYQNLEGFMPSLVQRVTKHSLERFLTEGAPANLPRVLLFTEKEKIATMYRKLSVIMDRRAWFGQAPADEELAAKFGITEFPALVISPPEASDPSASSFRWPRYKGRMNYFTMLDHLQKVVPAYAPPYLGTQTDFETHCVSKGGVCFIAILPPKIASLEAHQAFTDATQNAFIELDWTSMNRGQGPTVSSMPVSFAWVLGPEQSSFVKAFAKLQTPGLVAVNPRKKMYSTFFGSLESKAIVKFVQNVVSGSEELATVDSIPRLKVVPLKEGADEADTAGKSEDSVKSKKAKKSKGGAKKGKKAKKKKSKKSKTGSGSKPSKDEL